MSPSSPVLDASRFLARLSELSPDQWRALGRPGDDPTVDDPTLDGAAAPPALAAALRALALPGRREAYTVLVEWLDALATPVLAAAAADPGWSTADAARALARAERAALALLVSDALSPRWFAELYAPFAPVLPIAALRQPAAP